MSAAREYRTIRVTADATVNHIIASKGYPVPALTESGSLPTGLTFTDKGNGTAAITGTPAAGSTGHYLISVKAGNGLGTGSRTFILTVRR
jgi:Putative Ig domain